MPTISKDDRSDTLDLRTRGRQECRMRALETETDRNDDTEVNGSRKHVIETSNMMHRISPRRHDAQCFEPESWSLDRQTGESQATEQLVDTHYETINRPNMR